VTEPVTCLKIQPKPIARACSESEQKSFAFLSSRQPFDPLRVTFNRHPSEQVSKLPPYLDSEVPRPSLAFAQIIQRISETGHRMQPLRRGSIGRVRVGIHIKRAPCAWFSFLDSTAMIRPSPRTHTGYSSEIWLASLQACRAQGLLERRQQQAGGCIAVWGSDELTCGELC
jgi:hypothetical protein